MHRHLSEHIESHYLRNPACLYPLRNLTRNLKAVVPDPENWTANRVRAELSGAGYLVGLNSSNQLMVVGLVSNCPAWRLADDGHLERVLPNA